ncbi:hypothetical protein F3Y22_tig00116971pilonHSYRG00361 [Hibiscus syriacus]|uniref:Sulfotransferase n=1 Tax=Hibiscus syriacus TaxID=106335 RepID=A0A6A2WH43_HIBSY|nr:hypothetical protein F3Y22_tig00116971pilonHSYRG00361 [Hibiscus syriacus]
METPLTFFPTDKEVELDEGYQKTYKNFDELLPTLPSRRGWWFDQLFQYQGFWLSAFALRGTMLVHDHFEPRPTDIIVATSPKCGTTWLKALVYAIINRDSFDFSDHPLSKASHRDLMILLELHIRGRGSTSFVDGLPSPRVISTHIPFSLFPRRITDDSSPCRFVYLCRDPKDVLVSKWHFSNKVKPKELPSLTLEEAFESFCEGVLFLKYEDMKKEPWGCVRKVAEFLGVSFSAEEEKKEIVKEIVKLCSFENMSNQDVNKRDTKNREYPVSNADFFRKGEVGDWVNHLSPQMVEALDKITYQKFEGSGLSFN